jgi:hypothetical protein
MSSHHYINPVGTVYHAPNEEGWNWDESSVEPDPGFYVSPSPIYSNARSPAASMAGMGGFLHRTGSGHHVAGGQFLSPESAEANRRDRTGLTKSGQRPVSADVKRILFAVQEDAPERTSTSFKKGGIQQSISRFSR